MTAQETILIVDDETRIIELARMYIEREGFSVESATDGAEAYRRIVAKEPSLVVLDIMLPGMDGLDICRKLRTHSDVPIIMLTALNEDIDKIVALELGADDYLTKPFNPRELVARIKAILRRTERRASLDDPGDGSAVVIGNLTINPERRTVTLDGQAVRLRMKEFDLLYLLARHPERVFTREQLLEIVWGYDFAGETRTVDVHIAHLRHKLRGMQARIETVWGKGYKLEATG